MVRAKSIDVKAIREEYQRTHTAGRSASTMPGARGDVTDAEAEFGYAIDGYKRLNHRPYPTYGEILAVLAALGYKQEPEKVE